MKNVTSETPIGEIVRAMPASARIFEKLHIDYCCGGKKSLAEVCKTRALDPATVVAMLSALDTAPNGFQRDPDAMTLSELCDHIQEAHHAYLQEELPRLDFLTRKVAAVHGAHEPRLLVLRQVFEDFNAEMTSHTEEENQTVFPAIRKLETGKHSTPSHVRTICKKLEHEHDHAGAALELFNQLTDGYTPPDWACTTFRTLYDSLAHLEKDMHQHVHKENNVLFPKAIAAAA
jgi:regulator of cell morphogenesis and NO signaling